MSEPVQPLSSAGLPFDPAVEAQKLLDLRAKVYAGAYPQFAVTSSNSRSTPRLSSPAPAASAASAIPTAPASYSASSHSHHPAPPAPPAPSHPHHRPYSPPPSSYAPPPAAAAAAAPYRYEDDYRDGYRSAHYPSYPDDAHKRKAADWPDDPRKRAAPASSSSSSYPYAAHPPPPPPPPPSSIPPRSPQEPGRPYYDDYARPSPYYPPSAPAPYRTTHAPPPPPPPVPSSYDYRPRSPSGSIQMSTAVLPSNVVVDDGYTRDTQRGYELFIPSAAKKGRYLPQSPGSPTLSESGAGAGQAGSGSPRAEGSSSKYGQYAPPPPPPPPPHQSYPPARREEGRRWGGYPPPP
ncbi:hypothetical protein BZA70DRAFT_266808 [Myxozyma melibiosi]|uniref:Uncharacterized protein n=1 Tax=Myxozyma melibiosi TaxID=54550 RepID=A0ABR1F9B3_9ASCO